MILLSEILSKVSEKDIMEHYYHCSITDRKAIYKNIIRNDKEGTCYFNWFRGHYYLVDRGRGIDFNFNCFTLVRHLYNCTFAESLFYINKDMNLNLSSDVVSVPGRKVVKETKVDDSKLNSRRKLNYEIKARKWNDDDVIYWNRFNITTETLIKFNVLPVSSFKSDCDNFSFNFKTMYTYTKEDPCYCYAFKRKKKIKVKIYRPFNTTYKWQGNTSSSDIFGYDQLPEYTNVIYICSSLKDLMCLHEMGLIAIAPQSESTDIPEDILNELQYRCNKFIILFDNDKAGVLNSIKYAKKYACRYITLPEMDDNKDVADFVEDYGIETTKQIILKCKLKIN